MQARTTIVIPNYNGIKYLDACLSSLGDYPVVVVDNGSADESVSFIRENYPEIKLVCNEENKGFCGAVNQGIALVETPFVFLLNNDTVVREGCIEALEKRMDSDEKIFSVQAKMLQFANPELIDDAGDLYCALGWAFAIGKGKNTKQYNTAKKVFAGCGGAVLYRMDYLKITDVFDERHFAYLEDMDLGYRARILGYENWMEPAAEILHVGSGSSGSRHNKFKVDLSSGNSVYLYCKNMPFLQALLNLPFFILGVLIKTAFFARKGLGAAYVKGVFRGIVMSFDKEGRKKHVAFRIKNLKNYVFIQLELWWNLVRRLVG